MKGEYEVFIKFELTDIYGSVLITNTESFLLEIKGCDVESYNFPKRLEYVVSQAKKRTSSF